MTSWITLGGDPARFWDLTPRLYALEQKGLLERLHAQRSLVWFGAALPHLKKQIDHDDFVYGRAKPKALRVREWAAAWDKIDRALAANKTRRPS